MISVCLTTFNGSPYVKDQISSILEQIESTDELIIFDDLSEDNTVEIIRELADDKRIFFKQNAYRLGIVKNFEQALMRANGDFIFLCDQDDIWLPNRVERCVKELRKNVLVVTDCKIVNQDLNIIHPSFFELRQSGTGIIKNIIKNSYLGCCMAFRKDLLPYILPIPKKAPMHDMLIGLIAETIGSVEFIEEQLLLYRRHGSNASPTAEVSEFSLYHKIKFRLVLCYLLIVRYIRNLVSR